MRPKKQASLHRAPSPYTDVPPKLPTNPSQDDAEEYVADVGDVGTRKSKRKADDTAEEPATKAAKTE